MGVPSQIGADVSVFGLDGRIEGGVRAYARFERSRAVFDTGVRIFDRPDGLDDGSGLGADVCDVIECTRGAIGGRRVVGAGVIL